MLPLSPGVRGGEGQEGQGQGHGSPDGPRRVKRHAHHPLLCTHTSPLMSYLGVITVSEPRELPHSPLRPHSTPLSGCTAAISPVSTDGHLGSFQHFATTIEVSSWSLRHFAWMLEH